MRGVFGFLLGAITVASFTTERGRKIVERLSEDIECFAEKQIETFKQQLQSTKNEEKRENNNEDNSRSVEE